MAHTRKSLAGPVCYGNKLDYKAAHSTRLPQLGFELMTYCAKKVNRRFMLFNENYGSLLFVISKAFKMVSR